MGLRLFTAGALLALLTACGVRDTRYNPLHFRISGAAAPPEIVLPAKTKPGSTIYGITTTAPDFEGLCCAADAHVKAPVRKESPAASLRIGIYVPKGKRERLRVKFPDGTVEYQDSGKTGKTGLMVLSFPVPASLRGRRGVVPVAVDASQAPYVLISIFFE